MLNQNRRKFMSQMASATAGAAVLANAAQTEAQETRPAPARREPIGDPSIPLEIIFLGTGSPGMVMDERRGGSCEVIMAFGEPLLFDVGHLALHNLAECGLHPNDIQYLFFTHTYHYDHFSEFGSFVQIRALRREPPIRQGGAQGQGRPAEPGQRPARPPQRNRGGGAGPLYVYGPGDTQDRIDLILHQVYAEDIRAQNLVRRDAVKVHLADEGVACQTEKWTVTSTHVAHGPNALGFRIDAGDKSMAISGDVAEPSKDPNARPRIVGFPCESIEQLAEGVDLFIIDTCGKHSSPKELAAAVARVNPGRVLLTHVINTRSGNTYRDEVMKVYKGEVTIAENQMRIRV